MDHVVCTNIKDNSGNPFIDNKIKFDSNFSLSNDHIKYTQPEVTFEINKGKRLCMTYANGMGCLWDSGSSNIMINLKHINKIRQDTYQ